MLSKHKSVGRIQLSRILIQVGLKKVSSNQQLCGDVYVALAYRDGVQPLKSKGAFEWLVNG
ncbi:hypothetical protein GCM10008022_39580 [Paenibacillus hunanensis]|nr:hypothetical protein GCM10008022_39580 [Paenibacillus hunanensis]